MATQARGYKSIAGKRFGVGAYGQAVSNGVNTTALCADASITVGDETTNVRPITIQLKDANGNDIDYAEVVKLYVFSDATKQALATGGSTGIAAGTDGAILRTITAKKQFELVSESDGDIDLTWTDTGTESVVLGLLLPTGRWVLTDAFANA